MAFTLTLPPFHPGGAELVEELELYGAIEDGDALLQVPWP